jgi:hypothetical protein
VLWSLMRGRRQEEGRKEKKVDQEHQSLDLGK